MRGNWSRCGLGVAVLAAAVLSRPVDVFAFGWNEGSDRLAGREVNRALDGVVTFDREAIAAFGAISVGDLLRRLPQVGTAPVRLNNERGAGRRLAALRNLGAERTLVRVNGRRWPATGPDGSVDLDSIPLVAVESIDIRLRGDGARDGAAAMAGVVDIRLIRGFHGASVGSQWGEYEHGDGVRQRHEWVLGMGTRRGGATIAAGHVSEDPVAAAARPISAVPTFGLPPTDITAAGAAVAGPVLDVSGLGLVSLPPGADGADPDSYLPYTGGYGYNVAPERYLQPEQARTSLFMAGHYRVLDNVNFSSQLIYNERMAGQRLFAPVARGGYFDTSSGFGTHTIAAGSIYNPFDQEIVAYVRRLPELGGRRVEQEARLHHLSISLDGDLGWAERRWHWLLGYQHGNVDEVESTDGLNALNLAHALGPSFVDGSGIARCGTSESIVAGCVPLNVFSSPGGVTRDMASYIRNTSRRTVRNTLDTAWAELSTQLFEWIADHPATANVGYEHRRETIDEQSDAFSAATLGEFLAYRDTSGAVATNEWFMRADLPLAVSKRWIEALNLRLAARLADHSSFGSISRTSVSLAWRPAHDLTLVGELAEGYRAPGIRELYQDTGSTLATAPAADFCSAGFWARLNQVQRDRCRATGAQGDFSPSVGTYPGLLSGNPALEPERLRGRWFALEYAPPFVQNLTTWIGRQSIQIDDVVQPLLQPSDVLVACYLGTTTDLHERFCQRIHRADSGQIVGVNLSPANLGELSVAAWEGGFAYQLELGAGRLEMQLLATYLESWRSDGRHLDWSADELRPLPQSSGSLPGRELGDDMYSRMRSHFAMAWHIGDLSVDWSVRHASGVKEACRFGSAPALPGVDDLANPCSHHAEVSASFPGGYHRLGSMVVHDMSVAWRTPWGGRIRLGINNVFDKVPPVSYLASAHSFNVSEWGAPGRFWFARIEQTW